MIAMNIYCGFVPRNVSVCPLPPCVKIGGDNVPIESMQSYFLQRTACSILLINQYDVVKSIIWKNEKLHFIWEMMVSLAK